MTVKQKPWGRWAVAHILSTCVGVVAIFTGVKVLMSGPIGFAAGLTGALSGMLLFLVIAVFSIPIGVLLRFLVGFLPIPPIVGAVGVGLLVSFYAMMVLHPEISPLISLETHPVGLVVVHAVAGILGGALWWAIEFFRPASGGLKPVGGQ